MPAHRIPVLILLSAVLMAFVGSGCAALHDDMQRAEQSYDAARYEDALIWFRDLERDAPSMSASMRARYYYLRGMTEYRLGHRLPALHYLAVAREVAGEDDVGLRPEWRQMMDRTLAELTPRGMTHRPPDEVVDADHGASAGGETSGGESPDEESVETPPASEG